ncbi:MAG TPA: hypothetical protein GXZ64_02390 [Clostridiaceae bacterium]|nr:hypothetical protein [Clostridiaceae bacterium]
MRASLKSIDYLHVRDKAGMEYYGCNQEWYSSIWRRLAGCGPSVAATLLLYLQRAGQVDFPVTGYEKKDCLGLMEDVWTHVTPTIRGVNTGEIFCSGIRSFAAANGFTVDCEIVNVPKCKHSRPLFLDLVSFIGDGLNRDCPVAFLNLHNGKVKSLEAWHWVTVVSLEADDSRRATLTVFDGDKSAELDLALWFETTKKGGAFVYLKRSEQPA